MPELPEVESIKLQLQKYLIGHTVNKVDIFNPKTFKGDKDKITNAKVVAVRRFGKALVVDLNNDWSIVIHVKMTGQLIYRGLKLNPPFVLSEKIKGGLAGKHTHVIFHLDNKSTLYFIDYRKFGWIDTVESDNLVKLSFLKNLGPEIEIPNILQNQTILTFADFENIVKNSSRPIKLLIMEQTKMSGVGNIYANDALFLAGIDPRKKGKDLNNNQIKKLYVSITKTLLEGIKRGGASELAFVKPDGSEGNYQDFALVYGKEGKNCPNDCGGKIKKIKLGGRGTYFCFNCQK